MAHRDRFQAFLEHAEAEDRVFWLRSGTKARRALAARYEALAAYSAGEIGFEAAVAMSEAGRATFSRLLSGRADDRALADLLPARGGRPRLAEDRWTAALDWVRAAVPGLPDAPIDRIARMARLELGPSPPLDVLRALVRAERRATFADVPAFTIISVDQAAVDLVLPDGGYAIASLVVDVPTGLGLGLAIGSPGLLGTNARAVENALEAVEELRELFGEGARPPRVEVLPDLADPLSMAREIRRLAAAGAAIAPSARAGGILLDVVGERLGDLPFRPARTGGRMATLDDDVSLLSLEEAYEVVSFEFTRRNRRLLKAVGPDRFGPRVLVPSLETFRATLGAAYGV